MIAACAIGADNRWAGDIIVCGAFQGFGGGVRYRHCLNPCRHAHAFPKPPTCLWCVYWRGLLSPLPPIYVSSISTMPDSISPSFLHASRKRCSINHADFCVMPNSLPICKDDTPLRAVAIRYMAIKPIFAGRYGNAHKPRPSADTQNKFCSKVYNFPTTENFIRYDKKDIINNYGHGGHNKGFSRK